MPQQFSYSMAFSFNRVEAGISGDNYRPTTSTCTPLIADKLLKVTMNIDSPKMLFTHWVHLTKIKL